MDPLKATVPEIADVLTQLTALSPSHGRNTYSACLLLPGLQSLRFNVLMMRCKRSWSHRDPRYTAFWKVEDVLARLVTTPLSWTCVSDIRGRLLMVLRILHLMCSVDLSRIFRTVSFIGDRPFIRIQQKGWKEPRWEELISIPECPALSPWHLVKCYVALTASHAPAGARLFLSLKSHHVPLTADRLGS